VPTSCSSFCGGLSPAAKHYVGDRNTEAYSTNAAKEIWQTDAPELPNWK
jgi:hypothetical protein